MTGAATVLMQLRKKPILPPALAKRLYEGARQAASSLGKDNSSTNLTVDLGSEMIGMPRQLGFEKVAFKMTLKLNLTGSDPIDEIPEHFAEIETP